MNSSKTDRQLKQDIEEELRWDPKVNAAHIGVTVQKGAVSLMGAVDTYAEKWAAEDATKRVGGVRTIAEDLEVKLLSDHTRTDMEVAEAVQHALTWNVYIPKTVKAAVRAGVVTLEGAVRWNFEREAADHSVRYLKGVAGVSNNITLTPQSSASQVKEKVQTALQRQATADAKSIHIETSGGKVTLTGHASSWEAIENAALAAWSTPGVTQVIDEVQVSGSI